MLYKFELGHNTAKAIRYIYCAKDEGTVDYNTVTRWFKEFNWGKKDLDDRGRSESVLQAIEKNPVSSN